MEANLAASLVIKQQMNNKYLQTRDPKKEFFLLTCTAIKVNSPHMAIICNLKPDELYELAVKESIEFYQWPQWIEKTLHR
mmetsp:Transcript_4766/g.3282  ORF Transcript_4766/g.3282 Transcript_4766/m.3282 type:complete len:80 (-) Transcript_4766:121-360(-)